MYNILAFGYLFYILGPTKATFPMVRSELCNIHKLNSWSSFSRPIQIVIINSHNTVKTEIGQFD